MIPICSFLKYAVLLRRTDGINFNKDKSQWNIFLSFKRSCQKYIHNFLIFEILLHWIKFYLTNNFLINIKGINNSKNILSLLFLMIKSINIHLTLFCCNILRYQ